MYFWSAATMFGLLAFGFYLLFQELRPATTHTSHMLVILGVIGASLLLLFWRLRNEIHRDKEARDESEARYDAVFDNTAVGLCEVAPDGCILSANQGFSDIVGYPRETLQGGDFNFKRITTSEDDFETIFTEKAKSSADSVQRTLTSRCHTKTGRIVWLELFITQLRDPGGGARSYIIAAVDITAGVEAEDQLETTLKQLERQVENRTEDLQRSELRFRFLTENSADIIWRMNLADETLTYLSPSIRRLIGFTPGEVMERPGLDCLTEDSAEALRAVVNEVRDRWEDGDHSDTTRIIEVAYRHREGHIVPAEVVATLHPDEEGRLASLLGVTRDITERKRADNQIRHLAFYDGLTDLPNRRLLEDRLEHAIARADRSGGRLALLFIDLDKFKPINDEFGHQTGDWLLQAVAHRLRECLRAYDTAARMGGDEFVVLLPDPVHIEDALIVAERVRLSLAYPFVTDKGQELTVSSSIGVAIYPDQAENARDLLRVGDEAMYRAKATGRDKVELLDEGDLPWRLEGRPSIADGASIRLTWKPAFACGDHQIDTEHRHLFDAANHLLDHAMRWQDEPDGFKAEFCSLLDEVRHHFQHEESRLSEKRYEYIKEHAEIHRVLLERADGLRQKVDLKTITVGDIVNFVAVDLIADHVLKADRDFFKAFSQSNTG